MPADLDAQYPSRRKLNRGLIFRDSKVGVRWPLCTTRDIWTSPVSLEAFQERMLLVTRIRLPYTCYIANLKGEHSATGLIECFRYNHGWLGFRGRDFEFYFPEQSLGTIRVVSRFLERVTCVSVDLLSKSGCLIARLSGMPNKLENAVWRDIIGTLLL
jgi:putative heme degradation protein